MKRPLTILCFLPLLAILSWSNPEHRSFPPISPQMQALILGYHPMFLGHTARDYSPIDIRVLKGTTITVATVLTTGTGSITYDVGANITQLY